jgi:phosphatidylglycerophosphate synthase
MALLLNLVAAVCMYLGSRAPVLFLVSIAFLTIGGLADAFDGIVARVQEKSSRYGDFLDHVADRISDTAVAAGWMLGSGVRAELSVIGIFVIMLNGYIGTQIEATWRERHYELVGRGEFVLALIVYPIVSYIVAANGWRSTAPLGFSIAEWLVLALLAFALFGIGQRLALAARLERTR